MPIKILPPPPNLDKDIYKIITSKNTNITDSKYLEVLYETDVPEVSNKQRGYGECSRMYWVWKKYPNLKKYVGFCHYRRYFDFKNIPDLDKVFESYDIICHHDSPYIIGEQFKLCHNFDDLSEVFNISKRLFKIKEQMLNSVLEMNSVAGNNIFITKKETFEDYCNFLFKILLEFDKKKKLNSDEDILYYVKNNIQNYSYYANKNLNYQARLQGFMAERLLNLYIKYRNLNVFKTKCYNI